MLSFFRRKKPDAAATDVTKRPSIDELAAAFPQASPPEGDDRPADAPLPTGEAPADDPATAAPAQPDAAPAHPGASGTHSLSEPLPAEVIAAALETESAPGHMGAVAAHERVPEHPADTSAPEAASAPLAPTTHSSAADAAAEGKKGWRDRLRGSAFARAFGGLFSRNPKLDDDLLDEIETALLTADVGVAATTQLVESLRKRMKARDFADAQALLAALRADLLAMLRPVTVPLQIDRQAKPFVLLTVGVNGVGKTTTIGKLAKRFKDEGRTLMLAAGDTFRAAAVAQLQAWGDRNGVPVVAQGQNADAASVAFDALQAAKARGTEVLIADTAGRLHTQQGLMAELGKIKRVLAKLDPAAPHEVLMVIDGTTGQNALSQLRQFHAAVGVTGLVVTKLDGTAKGGVVFALAREFGIPIRFAGIGERPEDLRVFDAEAFVDALLPEALGA
ncbi:signal recognition particle-docking protein FtsY [Lysobacter olei]